MTSAAAVSADLARKLAEVVAADSAAAALDELRALRDAGCADNSTRMQPLHCRSIYNSMHPCLASALTDLVR